MSLIFFIFSYILTWGGFLLGKATLEEHSEIEKTVRLFNKILLLITYALLFTLFAQGFVQVITLLFVFLLYVIGFIFYKQILPLHHLLFFGVSFFILKIYDDYIFLLLLVIFFLLIENSLKKFHMKEQLANIVILFIVYFGLSFLFQIY